MKKFVEWWGKINTFYAMLTKLMKNMKKKIYKWWKLRSKTLIMNHFIINGMVTRRSRNWVPWSFIMSLFFNINFSLYFDTLLAMYTEVKSEFDEKKSIFFYINTTSRNNKRQLLTAMSIAFKHSFPLCLSTLCHAKQVNLADLIFL